MSVESVTLSNHLILCPSFLLLPSIFSIIKVFSNVWAWFEVHLCWILHAIAVFLDSLFFLIDLPDYAYANITLIMEALDWHIYTIVYEIVSGKLLNNTGSPAHALWWPRGVGLGEGKEGREGRDIYVLYGYILVWSQSVVSDSLQPHGLWPTRLLGPWDFPGMNTGVGCHFLLQGIFLTQGSNPGLPHCMRTLYHLSYQGSLCVYIPGGASGKEPACQCKRHKGHRFDPWVRKIPWKRAWQPTPVFLPGEPHR